MKAAQHILKLYPELKTDEFTYHLVCQLMESYAKEQAKYAYPNKEADGYVFCGKCGTAI